MNPPNPCADEHSAITERIETPTRGKPARPATGLPAIPFRGDCLPSGFRDTLMTVGKDREGQMQVTIDLPDELAQLLQRQGDLPRQLLEAYASDGYRTEKLTQYQVGQLLGLDRWKTEEFLANHNAQRPYTLADWSLDRRTLGRLKAG
jgi:hypothetical protein